MKVQQQEIDMEKIEVLKHGIQLFGELLEDVAQGDMPTQRQFSEAQKAFAAMVDAIEQAEREKK